MAMFFKFHIIFFPFQYANRLEQPTEKTTGRQLQRILQYCVTPCRPLPTFRRAESSIHDTDCDEVYPSLYIGDMYVLNGISK